MPPGTQPGGVRSEETPVEPGAKYKVIHRIFMYPLIIDLADSLC